jgi:hypothetical protein
MHRDLPDAGRITHPEIDARLPTAEEKQALRGADLDTVYFGDPDTDGSWRIYFDGTDLLIQSRESGTWTTQGRFTPDA